MNELLGRALVSLLDSQGQIEKVNTRDHHICICKYGSKAIKTNDVRLKRYTYKSEGEIWVGVCSVCGMVYWSD